MAFLNMHAVNLHLNARSKAEALDSMCFMLYKAGAVTSAEAFRADVENREKLGTTGIGNSIAIPHGRSLAVKESCIAVARLNTPVYWETLDDKPVRAIILFAVRNDGDGSREALHMMSQVAKLLARDTFCGDLLKCRTKGRLKQLFSQIKEQKAVENLNIIAVTACPAGIAHTYIAKERLMQAAYDRNHSMKVETQGSMGRENELTPHDIREADAVIIAADVEIEGADRFLKAKLVKVPVSVAIEAPGRLLQKIETRLIRARQTQNAEGGAHEAR